MKKRIKLLAELKKKQNKIKNVIADLEKSIVADIPDLKIEGTTKMSWGSITTKLNRKLDYEAYQVVMADLPEKLRFVSLQPKIDLKKLRLAEIAAPADAASCITTQPG